MNKLNKAIKRTEEYFARYGVKLTDKELDERLISKQVFRIHKVFKVHKVGSNKIYLNKIRIAKRISKKISKISDVLLMGMTGSVAAGRPKRGDDIDFLIITKKNRLWLTRLRLYWKLRQEKIRRKNEEERENQLCFNLWLDEIGLSLPKEKQNLRNAMDAIMMKVLVDKKNTYKKFLIKNSWIKKFVATGYNQKILDPKFEIQNKFKIQNLKFLNILNKMCYWLQKKYMRKRMTGELVNLHQAFFHPGKIKHDQ